MPTFDFRCQNCGSTFEFSRPFGSKEIPPCPECSSTNVEKMIHPPSIQFKGEGFYKTDTTKAVEKKEKNEKETKDIKATKDEPQKKPEKEPKTSNSQDK